MGNERISFESRGGRVELVDSRWSGKVKFHKVRFRKVKSTAG